MSSISDFKFRCATMDDLQELQTLMELSIRKYIGNYLTYEQVEASFEIMGLDTQLIADGSYFVVEYQRELIGSGGWSARATLYGGDHTGGRDPALLNPATEPARIRAMYTHPLHGRKGIGASLLWLCEGAAELKKFKSLELMSTISGEPLYKAKGYKEVERIQVATSSGVKIPLIRMSKMIG